MRASSLFSASIREATFTTSPMTVYSLRCAEPMLPTTAVARVKADADARSAGSCPSATSCSTRVDDLERRVDGRARARLALGDRRAEDAMKPSPRNLFTMPWCSLTASIVDSKTRVQVVDDLAPGVLLSAKAVKLRMSRNITHTSRTSLFTSVLPATRRSTTSGETCWPKTPRMRCALADRLDRAREAPAEPPRDEARGDAAHEQDDRLAEVMGQRRERGSTTRVSLAPHEERDERVLDRPRRGR